MYQALYRKYRPRRFDDVVGQEHITETLKAQVAADRLSHAYLFIGTRGTGKTTCAKILAKAANCEHPVNGDPCGECAACLGIDDGSVLDVVEIDAASNNGVDNVRSLRDEAVFSPASVKKRVYIIDEVHMLSGPAFNALLKILEEPPEHLMFILATTELRKVPATILSRCQRYSFRRIDDAVIASRLAYVAGREGLNLSQDAAALLSRLADGSLRDALSLLDQCSGVTDITPDAVLSAMGLAGNRRVAELLSAISERDAAAALELFAQLYRDGKDPAGLLADMCTLLRDLMILSVAPGKGAALLSGGYDRDTLSAFSGRFTSAELLRDMDCIQHSLASLRDNPAKRTAAELCIVSLCDSTLTDGLPELRARVSRLEAGTPAPQPVQKTKPRKEPSPPPVIEKPVEPTASPAAEAPAEEPPVVHEPSVEAEPVIEPTPLPEPNASPSPTANFGWEELVKAVTPLISPGFTGLLCDSLQADGRFDGECFTLRLAKGFAADMLNKPEITEVFRQEASRLAGHPVTLRVELMDSDERIAKRNLDDLAAFGARFK